MNPKIIAEEPISMYELKEQLEKIKKRDTELNIRTSKTEEYLKNFTVLSDSDAVKLKKEIVEMNVPRIKDQHISKIVDVLPENDEELRVVLQGYNITLSKENSKKITDLVSKYTEKKQ